MQSYTGLVLEAAVQASIGKEQQPVRERASCRRRDAKKAREWKAAFKREVNGKDKGNSNSGRVKVKRGEQLFFPPAS